MTKRCYPCDCIEFVKSLLLFLAMRYNDKLSMHALCIVITRNVVL